MLGPESVKGQRDVSSNSRKFEEKPSEDFAGKREWGRGFKRERGGDQAENISASGHPWLNCVSLGAGGKEKARTKPCQRNFSSISHCQEFGGGDSGTRKNVGSKKKGGTFGANSKGGTRTSAGEAKTIGGEASGISSNC